MPRVTDRPFTDEGCFLYTLFQDHYHVILTPSLVAQPSYRTTRLSSPNRINQYNKYTYNRRFTVLPVSKSHDARV